jgi:hypothetical protein
VVSDKDKGSRRDPADAEAGRDIPRGTDEDADDSAPAPKRGDAAPSTAPVRNDEPTNVDRDA